MKLSAWIEKIARCCVVVTAATLVGCTSSYYSASSSLTPQNSATLIGSRVHDPNPVKLDTLVMPTQVDGLMMGSAYYNDASSRWNKPFLISPGMHHVMATISIGGSFDASAWGFANFNISLQPGKTYRIAATAPAPFPGSNTTLMSHAWLQDDAGIVLTPRVPVQVGVYGGGDMIGLPSSGGQPQTFVLPHQQ